MTKTTQRQMAQTRTMAALGTLAALAMVDDLDWLLTAAAQPGAYLPGQSADDILSDEDATLS